MNDVLGTRSWENFQDILNGAVGLAEELKPLQQFVLANLILLGENTRAHVRGRTAACSC